MKDFPDHPDIKSALDTGYPRSHWEQTDPDEDDCGPDPDDAYEEYRARRDEQARDQQGE